LSTDNVAAAILADYREMRRARPRRIVQVSAFYPPHLGGQESVVQQLSLALDKAGAEISVVSSRLPATTGEPDAIPVKRLSAREIAHTPVMPGLPLALTRRARSAVFHLHTGQAFVPETVALVSGLLRRPYISHIHLLVRPSGRFGRLLPIYQRVVLGVVLRRSAAVVCLTETMRQEVISAFGVASEQAIVIPNGVGNEWYIGARRAARPGKILFVGRLSAQKNLAVVIQALADLPHAELTVIGDGEELPTLEALVSSLGLTNVTFVGRQGPDEIRRAMLQSAVLVLPSTHEGMPLVVLEACAAGLPVVASDIPELREAGLAGRLVPPNDPAAWVATLGGILGDDSALEEMSKEGVRRARNQSWEHVATQWMDLYDLILGEPLARSTRRRKRP
jgi:glycosyltransferase involved in cell wall biosynthesis